MSFIRSADAALYYEEYGAGETLVLIPGLFGTIELDWRRFIPDFSRHFHTIAVDLRGHGKTDNPSGDLSPGRLVADLGVLFDTLEIDRAFLCTHGPMAPLPLDFAVRWPSRSAGLILHGPRLDAFNRTSLRDLAVPILVTVGDEGEPDGSAEQFVQTVSNCVIVHLPRSGGVMDRLQKHEFVEAVLQFSHRITGTA